MNALAIDCSVSKISIAAKSGVNMAKLTLDVGIKQSEKLLPAIDFVCKELNLEAKDLDYTALTLGPGTFTGLRLGMSALKAINLAFGVPCYAIPSLEVYAHPYNRSLETVLSLIEAKEDEFFYAFFVRGEKLRAEEDKSIEDILKQIDPETSVLACGPSARQFVERVNEITPLYAIHSFSPENDGCESLFEIAEEMIKNKKEPLKDYDGPLYVRKSEAEIVLEKKQGVKD